MKGIGVLTLVLALSVVTLVIAISLLATAIFLRVQLINQIELKYEFNNAQLVLLTLLSSTHNGEKISKLLAEHIILNEPSNVDFLKIKLDKLVDSKCYRLSTSSKTIIESKDISECSFESRSQTALILPYSQEKVVELILEMSR